MKNRVCVLGICLMLITTLTMGAVTAQAGKKEQGIRLNRTSATVKQGKSIQLKFLGTGKKKLRSVKWSSGNSYNASVSKNGKVTGKRLGNVTITVKVGKKKYRCKVRVCSNLDKKDIPEVYNNSIFTKELAKQLDYAKNGMGTLTVKDKLAVKAIFSKFAAIKLTEVPYDTKYDDVMGGLSVSFTMKNGQGLSAGFKKDRLCVSNGKQYEYQIDEGFDACAREIRELLDKNQDYGDW